MDNPLLLFCPFPTIHSDGTLCDGISLSQDKYCCDKCSNKECRHFLPDTKVLTLRFYTCQHGYSVITTRVGKLTIRINGVIETGSNTAKASFKKKNKDRKIKSPVLHAWLKSFIKNISGYNDEVEIKAKDNIHALHDIKSLISSILDSSQKWIWEQDGISLDDKIENSPPPLRKIYEACELVVSLLQITDILINPEVAKFGTPSEISIHGKFFKLTKIHEEKAKKNRNKFRLGRSNAIVPLYSSFILIPHILIDNAIKHSEPGSEIRIAFHDRTDGSVYVDFSSYGSLVPLNEQTIIFDRGIRGSNAKKAGSGLGLYIAKLVAEANGFKINYRGKKRGEQGDKGINHFLFEVPAG